MRKPVIGILVGDLAYPEKDYNYQEKIAVNAKYVESVRAGGGYPLLIPVTQDANELFDLLLLCHGLLIPGGEDVDPAIYGENPHAALGEVKPELDQFTIWAIDDAEKLSLPVLGICKGMQILNVYYGGTLYQDLSQRKGETYLHNQHGRRDYGIHKVKVKAGTHLSKILGGEEVVTNSMHHQCVKDLGRNLTLCAWTEDGVAEGFESDDGTIVAVQWHPEEMAAKSAAMLGLFKDLADRARTRIE